MYKLFIKLCLFFMGLLFQTVYLHDNSTCVNSIYMKIHYTSKLINNYIGKFLQISSAYDCLELCKNNGTCKSVGIETSSMTCYLYNDRIYAGLNGTKNINIVYYWLLEPQCPIQLGYTEDPVSKICAMYNDTKVTWLEAQTQCQQNGGFLFMADTPESQNVLKNTYTTGQTFYLGATDMYDEDEWNWFNGVPINRSHFFDGNPNNIDDAEHCLVYLTALADIKCKSACGFLCQIPTVQTYLPSNMTV